MSKLVQETITAIRKVISEDSNFIPLHEPSFQGNEWEYVKDTIDSTFVSSVGKYVDRFENDLAEFTGVKRAVAVVNGTAALHVSLTLIGIKKDDEVLIPSLTFIATANAVSYCQAIPHFVDSEEETLGVDPFKLKNYLAEIAIVKNNECFNKNTGRRIKAIIPMHTFGHSVDMDPLIEVCQQYHIELIEDAAESLGSYYKGQHTGSFGKLSAMSFNGNKIMTTGGGGAILTNDDHLADRAKHITTTAKVPHKWEYFHDQVGFNYRMPNINAALGCAQLEKVPNFLERKRKLAQKYITAFKIVEGISFKEETENTYSNYWLNALILDEDHEAIRDELLQISNDSNFMARPVWTLMNHLPMFKGCPAMDLTCAESLERRIINIPSSASLGAR
ncbi:LegC family aminotransferase [Alkalicoccus halolimnae]|uniref:LegC family aminotransferase n=1 Tax=Alkalicoccus halolimnae TaxID=1667239 RepID=A0A5C7FQP2_9BACI|nr:LegC family aminotransferase [Alkalicoccus halolimnae]TXF87015.1 LegC family aminotransferase [Alkalicoccus halolimnae]